MARPICATKMRPAITCANEPTTDMNLVAELKRRKVFKVGVAYLVVGWLLIQVAATVAPQLNLPDWAPRFITFAIALGFPIALVLAWIFDVGPSGIRREVAVAAAASSAAPVTSAPASLTTSSAPVPPSTAPAIPHKSIAVLPFADLSPARDQEYFSDGIAEEILNALVKVKDLKVTGRTSSFSFKGKNEDLRSIGKTLSVAHVLEGSVRKHGDKVRITAQLIRTDNGYHLWSENYDGDLSDVFELQERIARAITRELDVILHGEQRLVPVATTSPEAYALYLHATSIFNRRDGAQFPEAIELLHKAIALDPRFARAHARLAAIHALEPVYAPAATEAALAAVEREAALAIALDPKLAEPHAALAMMHAQRARLIDAHMAMEHALTIDPDDLTTNLWAGILAYSDGYIAKACAHFDRLLVIDPLVPNALLWRGREYLNVGDIARAEVMVRRAAELGLAHAGVTLHQISAAQGRMDEARAQLAEGAGALGSGVDPAAPHLLAAAVYGDESARSQVLALIERELDMAHDGRFLAFIPYALLMLGEYRRVLTIFQRERVNNSPLFFFLLWSPAARTARSLPEFAEFARKNGFVELWDRYGPPDGCHKNAAGEYIFD
jgi:TolB-like protein